MLSHQTPNHCNRYVEGNISRITAQDHQGNTCQKRTLADGSVHSVLKNFPTEAELQAAIMGLGAPGRLTQWPYYWAFEYLAAGP